MAYCFIFDVLQPFLFSDFSHQQSWKNNFSFDPVSYTHLLEKFNLESLAALTSADELDLASPRESMLKVMPEKDMMIRVTSTEVGIEVPTISDALMSPRKR